MPDTILNSPIPAARLRPRSSTRGDAAPCPRASDLHERERLETQDLSRPGFSGAGYAVQQVRETVEGAPYVLEVPGVPRIGILILSEDLLASSGHLPRALRR